MQRADIKIVIADDHPIVRRGVMAALAQDPQMIVAAVVGNMHDLARTLDRESVNVVILDVKGMGGPVLSLVERLAREQPRLAIIGFSSSVALAPEFLRAGARGYVAKEDVDEHLVVAIHTTHCGGLFLSPVADEYVACCGLTVDQFKLTPSELSVLKLNAEGCDTAEIATQLGLSEKTVRNYFRECYRKTGCTNRTQLATWYEEVLGHRQR
ncbi:MAG: response regulator transcription factor [Chloroflexota bacterium]|nr:response regulator transcription factor [Chloroflexota bacterium]PLS77464.1 MAG: hypothetical protein CYG59_23650 [Chloroflexota bacterium]